MNWNQASLLPRGLWLFYVICGSSVNCERNQWHGKAMKGPTPILPANLSPAGRKQLPQASPRSSVPWHVGRGFPRCCDEHSCYTSRSARNTPGVCTCRASTNGWLGAAGWGPGLGLGFGMIWSKARLGNCLRLKQTRFFFGRRGRINYCTHFHWLEEFRRENTTPMTPISSLVFFLNGCFLCFFLRMVFSTCQHQHQA